MVNGFLGNKVEKEQAAVLSIELVLAIYWDKVPIQDARPAWSSSQRKDVKKKEKGNAPTACAVAGKKRKARYGNHKE